MKKLLMGALVACALFAGSAYAGEATGKVVNLIVRASDGLIYFWTTGAHNGRPACASNNTYWIIRDENSTTGKAQLAMLMQAYATGATIQIAGWGQCVRFSDGEDVNAIVFP